MTIHHDAENFDVALSLGSEVGLARFVIEEMMQVLVRVLEEKLYLMEYFGFEEVVARAVGSPAKQADTVAVEESCAVSVGCILIAP